MRVAGGGGKGRCNRCAARRSPGASNAIVGAPNVAPSKLAIPPPNECPASQICESG